MGNPFVPTLRGVAALCAMCIVFSATETVHAGCVIPTDGMVITADTTLCPGVYDLPSGLTIAADNVTLTGVGVTIRGGPTGSGISADGRANVTILGLTVRGYYRGMRVRNCPGARIEDCTLRDNYNDCLAQPCSFLDIFDEPEGPQNKYGHAIWLRYCDDAVLRGNDVRFQQNGISLFDCENALIEHNDASSNNGWGITLYNTNHSTVRYNVANDCIRIGSGHVGGDAAALLMVMGSSHNDVHDNVMVRGGDGLFLAGYRTYQLPCAYNVFARNDFSDSPNNGFEATFSHDNLFVDNVADRCNYGFWLGYSWNTEVRGNRMRDCYTAGVAIEHGYENVIADNEFVRNTRGIWLWTDPDASLVAAYPLNKDSHTYQVTGNVFRANAEAIRCEASGTNRFSYNYTITGNRMVANGYGVRFIRTTDSTITGNFILDSTTAGISFATSSDNNVVNNNYLANVLNASATGTSEWNTAKTPGTNIVSGPYLGGNYWSDYAGVDTDGDGLGNTLLPHRSGTGISTGGDNLPLVWNDPDCNRNGIPDASEPDCNANGIPDDCDLAAGLSLDCNGNGIPDDCDIATGTSLDLNGDGIPDDCQDCNANGALDPVEIALGLATDCNGNGIPDECDIAAGTSPDCNGNGIPDECEPGGDCNGNGIVDECELGTHGLIGAYYNTPNLSGPAIHRIDARIHELWGPGSPMPGIGPDLFSIRWTGYVRTTAAGLYTFYPLADDGVRLWVNGALLVDQWQQQGATEFSGTIELRGDTLYPIRMEYFENTGFAAAILSWRPPGGIKAVVPTEHLYPAQDCDGNGVLDDCDIAAGAPDCNGNGIPDACDITLGISLDANGDGIPDECADCNGNGIGDWLDIANGTSEDCDGNGVPDECDPDCNGNGIPDACELLARIAFAPADVYADVPGANWIAAGDLDGDGAPEIAVATASAAQRVRLLYNDGAGFFPTQGTVSTLASQHAVAIAPFNGDALNDIAVVDNFDRRIRILLNNGDGTFTESGSIATPADPVALSAGDLNGDGHVDLVFGFWAAYIGVFVNNGNGTFAPIVTYPVTGTAYVTALADFDGDGALDVAVANLTNVSVRLNNGDGTFGPEVVYTANGSAACVVAVDLNGDGWPDIAAANEYHNLVSVLLNNGDGTFGPRVPYPVGPNSRFLAAGDFDGDGHVDLVTANAGAAYLSVLANRGDGTFASAERIDTPAAARVIATADLTGDGRPDIFAGTSGGGLMVLRNASLPAAADCNGNGAPDECDLASGVSIDCNGNGVPDECDDVAGGDYNADGVTNATDALALLAVLNGPAREPAGDAVCHPLARAAFDADADGDLDMADFAAFALAASQP